MFFLLPAVASCLAYAQSTNALTEQIVELFTYEPGFVNKGETDHIKSDFSYVKEHFFRTGDYSPSAPTCHGNPAWRTTGAPVQSAGPCGQRICLRGCL